MKEVGAEHKSVVVLGRRGEHLARCVTFDIKAWQALYGEGAVQLLARRSGDETPYPCEVTVQGEAVRWKIRDTDVAVAGEGSVELQYRVGSAVVKSETYRTLTMESLGEAGPVPPEAEKTWVDQVLQAAIDAEASAEAARTAVKQTLTIGENGNWFSDGEDLGFPATGPRGESGFPAVLRLSGESLSLPLESNTDYRCTDPVTALSVTGFEPDPNGLSEVWSIHFAAGASVSVTLPESVVWNYGAAPVFTADSEYWLLFSPTLNGRILGVWNEVEA